MIPLYRLLKKDMEFKWEVMQEVAFEDIKQRVVEKEVVMIHNLNKPAILETDVLDYTIRAILSQKDEQGRKRPVTFYSRKMTDIELNYDIYNKELLVIVAALLEWRIYLEGARQQTEIIMDHRNLTYFI